MARRTATRERRKAAGQKPLKRARAIMQENGTGEPAFRATSGPAVALADKGELVFLTADFPMPDVQVRNHVSAVEDGDATPTVAPRAEDKILAGRARPGSNVEVVWL